MFHSHRLPRIKEKIAESLDLVTEQLNQLPDMPKNPEVDVSRGLDSFTTKTKAGLESTAFSSEWGKIAEEFRDQIIALKPRYNVKSEPPYRLDTNGRIDLTADDDRASIRSTPSHSRARTFEEYAEGQVADYPSPKRERVKGESNGNPGLFATPRRQGMGPALMPNSPSGRKNKGLAEIRTLIALKSKPGMPGLVSEEVYNTLCMEAVAQWQPPLETFIQKTEQYFHAGIEDILHTAFDGLHERRVYKEALSLLKGVIAVQLKETREALQRIYAIETNKFYTLDRESLERHRAAEARIIGRARHHSRWKAHMGEKGKDLPQLREWSHLSEEERKQEDIQASKEAQKLGDDPHKNELAVCAYVRGYYLTAASRFTDSITLHIISGLVPRLVDHIRDRHLDRQLGIQDGASKSLVVLLVMSGKRLTYTEPELFKRLMDEDLATSQRRAKLKNDRDRFMGAMQKIANLENPSANPSDQPVSPVIGSSLDTSIVIADGEGDGAGDNSGSAD